MKNFLVLFTLSQLYRQHVHLGVVHSSINPNMVRYLLPIKSSFSIMNLNVTLVLLKKSFNYMLHILEKRGLILLVNESKVFSDHLKSMFDNLNQPISYYNWSGGLLTNYRAVRSHSLKTYFLKKEFILQLFKYDSIGLLNSKTRNLIKSSFNFLKFKKELNRYIKNLNRLPNAIFVFDSIVSRVALVEANKLGITSLGICDSNSDSFQLNYGIPGNSFNYDSNLLYFKFMKLLILKGTLREKKNFLYKLITKKKSYRGLNFLYSNFPKNQPFNLSIFSQYFLKKGQALNPYLSIFDTPDIFSQNVRLLNLFLVDYSSVKLTILKSQLTHFQFSLFGTKHNAKNLLLPMVSVNRLNNLVLGNFIEQNTFFGMAASLSNCKINYLDNIYFLNYYKFFYMFSVRYIKEFNVSYKLFSNKFKSLFYLKNNTVYRSSNLFYNFSALNKGKTLHLYPLACKELLLNLPAQNNLIFLLTSV